MLQDRSWRRSSSSSSSSRRRVEEEDHCRERGQENKGEGEKTAAVANKEKKTEEKKAATIAKEYKKVDTAPFIYDSFVLISEGWSDTVHVRMKDQEEPDGRKKVTSISLWISSSREIKCHC